MNVINLDQYIKENKLCFRPGIVLDLIERFNKLKPQMVQKLALKKTIEPSECQYCKTAREISNDRQMFCKKHKAINEWSKIDIETTGRVNLFNHKLQIFGRYVITDMPTDANGVYVLWFGTGEEKDCVYCLSKTYFPGVFDKGFDISSLINPDSIVVYKNTQLYWEDDGIPRIENIK